MKKIIFLIFLLLANAILYSIVQIEYLPPLSLKADEEIELNLEVKTDLDKIETIILFFHEHGNLVYSQIEMSHSSENDPFFTANLGKMSSRDQALEYYFSIRLKDGSEKYLPASNPTMNPYSVPLIDSQKVSSRLILLSPDKNFSGFSKDFVIAISTFALSQEIIDFKLFFDGKDVTANTMKYSNMIVHLVKNALPGQHRFYLEATLTDGSEIRSPIWKHEVKIDLIELPFKFSGKGVFNSSLRTKDDQKKVNFLLTFRGSKKWFSFDSNVYLSSLETHSEQAVNRYFLRLQVPYLTMRMGDHSPNFGSFLLNGKNIRGWHSIFDTGKMRVFYSQGTLKRSIEKQNLGQSIFKRKSWALRFEAGNKNKFSYGLSFVKNKDEMNSLQDSLWIVGDSVAVQPQDNIVFGLDMTLSLYRQRVIMGAEAAMSYLNKNIYDGRMSLDSINAEYGTNIDIPIDITKYSDIFVVNKYIEPFYPGSSNLAYKFYLRSFFYNNYLNISHYSIGSSFNSLSTSSIQRDHQLFSISDNVQLLENRLSANAALNISSDNVNDTKTQKTSTLQYMIHTLYRFQENVFFRIGFCKNTTDNEADSLDITNDNFQLGGSYLWENITLAPTKFNVSYNNFYNANPNDTITSKRNNIVLSALSEFKELPMKTTLSISFSVNDENIGNSSLIKKNYTSFYLKDEFEFLDESLLPFIDYRFTSFHGDIDRQNTQYFNLGAQYKFSSQLSLSTNIGYQSYRNLADNSEDYHDLSWKFRFTQKF